MSAERTATPWWESQLPWLTDRLRRHAARFGERGEAEDLVQETLASFTASLRRRSAALPPAWTSAAHPPDEAAQQANLWAYLRTVLHRRIADGYRDKVARTQTESAAAALEDYAGLPDPNDEVARRELIAACASALAALSEDELEAIRLAIDGLATDRAMSPSERKRLSRARQRLSALVAARLTTSVHEASKPPTGKKSK